ncbi:hypothetical protein quinque_011734 [Culex quinquefasciatus]
MCDDTKGHVYPSAIPYTVPLPKQNNDHEHFDKLRDPTVMENVRLYLAYLKDAPPAVSFKGKTNTSVQLFLAGEGIPTYPGTLLRIFVAYHMSLGSTRTCALADLETLSRYVAAKRTKELQEARESHQKASNSEFPKDVWYEMNMRNSSSEDIGSPWDTRRSLMFAKVFPS